MTPYDPLLLLLLLLLFRGRGAAGGGGVVVAAVADDRGDGDDGDAVVAVAAAVVVVVVAVVADVLVDGGVLLLLLLLHLRDWKRTLKFNFWWGKVIQGHLGLFFFFAYWRERERDWKGYKNLVWKMEGGRRIRRILLQMWESTDKEECNSHTHQQHEGKKRKRL